MHKCVTKQKWGRKTNKHETDDMFVNYDFIICHDTQIYYKKFLSELQKPNILPSLLSSTLLCPLPLFSLFNALNIY